MKQPNEAKITSSPSIEMAWEYVGNKNSFKLMFLLLRLGLDKSQLFMSRKRQTEITTDIENDEISFIGWCLKNNQPKVALKICNSLKFCFPHYRFSNNDKTNLIFKDIAEYAKKGYMARLLGALLTVNKIETDYPCCSRDYSIFKENYTCFLLKLAECKKYEEISFFLCHKDFGEEDFGEAKYISTNKLINRAIGTDDSKLLNIITIGYAEKYQFYGKNLFEFSLKKNAFSILKFICGHFYTKTESLQVLLSSKVEVDDNRHRFIRDMLLEDGFLSSLKKEDFKDLSSKLKNGHNLPEDLKLILYSHNLISFDSRKEEFEQHDLMNRIKIAGQILPNTIKESSKYMLMAINRFGKQDKSSHKLPKPIQRLIFSLALSDYHLLLVNCLKFMGEKSQSANNHKNENVVVLPDLNLYGG